MAKDYGKKRYSTRRRGSISRPLLLALSSYLLGYLSASVFDLTSLTGWINAQVAKHTGHTVVAPVLQKAELPKPKFEFYTLLTSDHATDSPLPARVPAASSAEVVAASSIASLPIKPAAPMVSVKSTLPTSSVKGMYFVQIAAFKRKDEAERMKAKLAFKGILVTIVAVNSSNTNWYRVSVGPFSSRSEAEKAQVTVAQVQHIVGIIRKMDA